MAKYVFFFLYTMGSSAWAKSLLQLDKQSLSLDINTFTLLLEF